MFQWRAESRLSWICLLLYAGFVTAVINYMVYILESSIIPNNSKDDRDDDSSTPTGTTTVFWIPDLQFGYSAISLYEMLSSYGPDGRRLYLLIEAWDSFIYMQGYTFVLASILDYLLKSKKKNNDNSNNNTSRLFLFYNLLSILPFVVYFVDHIENTMQVYCTVTFDPTIMNNQWIFAATFGSIANMIKWLFFWYLFCSHYYPHVT